MFEWYKNKCYKKRLLKYHKFNELTSRKIHRMLFF
ncbi:hypothetical protein MHA_1449 [Mannheimia haemolytica PHL213]|nr:hypothetical protein MHA_1449 [Mannheimia haemolytica PHL213]